MVEGKAPGDLTFGCTRELFWGSGGKGRLAGRDSAHGVMCEEGDG